MQGVSVVIPLYNAMETIDLCLKSVLAQTYKDIQIVMTDDGSTDGCALHAKTFLDSLGFSNYKIISQKNSGPGSARNTAIYASDKKWIAFLDSDDEWNKDHLETLLSYAEESDCDLVCTAKNLNLKGPLAVTPRKMLFRCYVQSSTALVKRSLLNEIHFRDGKRYSEDYDLWLRLAFYGARMVVLPVCDVVSCNQKNSFGESGLSAHLWRMEKSELENYINLRKSGSISLWLFCAASLFSFAKYILRLFKTFIIKIKRI